MQDAGDQQPEEPEEVQASTAAGQGGASLCLLSQEEAGLTPAPAAVLESLPASTDRREIGNLAVWSVTSAKPSNSVALLRDGRSDTYWQSDNVQPHQINMQFQRKVRLSELAVQVDYKLDESYTPTKLAVRMFLLFLFHLCQVRVGTSPLDLKDHIAVDVSEPVGWIMIPLTLPGARHYLKAFYVQLLVVANHQNGRDTHIRQVKVFGPREGPARGSGHDIGFTTPEFSAYATLR